MFSDPSEPIPHIAKDHSPDDGPLQVGTKSFSLLFGTLGAIIVIAGLLMVFGMRFSADHMTYEAAREMTVKGTIIGVTEFACPAADGELERHLALKLPDGTYQVHLAPSRILRKLGWEFQPGNTIEVTGAPVEYRGKDGLLARHITLGDNVYTFRDAGGKLLFKQ